MPTRRFTVQVDERGRLVLPADVRSCLAVKRGGVIVIDVERAEESSVRLRKATEIARSGRGLLRNLAPKVDLASELIRERRAEAEREGAGAPAGD